MVTKSQINSFNKKTRILIVENESSYIDIHSKNLRDWGYEPIIAQGMVDELINDAIEKARIYHCHLAIVDMHLVDDHNSDDLSGLELIPQLIPTKSIIVSGSKNYRSAVDSVKQSGALDFIGKSESPKRLKEVLDLAAKKFCCFHRNVIFHYPPDLPPELIIESLCQDFDSEPDEVNEVISRLFPEADEFYITQWKNTSDLFTSVPRPRSYILKINPIGFVPTIVKLARAQKITKEYNNFNLYIKDKLDQKFHPIINKHEVLWNIGGIRYTLLGSDMKMETLFEYYPGHKTEEIIDGLRNFFCISWEAHYRQNRKKQTVPLTSAYLTIWSEKWFKKLFETNLETLGDDGTFDWKKMGGEDPFVWFQNHVDLNNPENDWSLLPDMEQAITHGDLHGDNILVDENNKFWIIDYERTGWGPILQDFVELEADILIRLASMQQMNFEDFYHICRILYESEMIQIEERYHLDILSPEYKKVFLIIKNLREIAHFQTHVKDARQYLWGLLLNILFRIVIINEQYINIHNDKKRLLRAEMYAFIICHRLDYLYIGKPWPPYDWPDLKTKDLRVFLQNFEIFDSDLTLQNFFIRYEFLKPFHARLHSMPNTSERIDNVIAYTMDKQTNGQNLLKNFLQALHDECNPGDARRDQLEYYINQM